MAGEKGQGSDKPALDKRNPRGLLLSGVREAVRHAPNHGDRRRVFVRRHLRGVPAARGAGEVNEPPRRVNAPRHVRPSSAATAREARLESGSPRYQGRPIRKFVGEVERGEKSISLDNLAHLARALRVPLIAMLKGLKPKKG